MHTLKKKVWEPPQILFARGVAWSKFYGEGPQTLGASTVQNLRRPGFVLW